MKTLSFGLLAKGDISWSTILKLFSFLFKPATLCSCFGSPFLFRGSWCLVRSSFKISVFLRSEQISNAKSDNERQYWEHLFSLDREESYKSISIRKRKYEESIVDLES